MQAKHVWIRGRVQGVGFRYSAQRKAASLGLAGWVSNSSDGAVEAVVQGPVEAVNAFLEWARRGPPSARVESVDARDESPDPRLGEFAIRH